MLILILLSNIGRGNMWSPHSPNTNQIYSLSTSIKQICTDIQVYKYIHKYVSNTISDIFSGYIGKMKVDGGQFIKVIKAMKVINSNEIKATFSEIYF